MQWAVNTQLTLLDLSWKNLQCFLHGLACAGIRLGCHALCESSARLAKGAAELADLMSMQGSQM
eukprot:scaffold117066_cov20-Tisochrysis_lutea.AAC.1